MAQPKCRHYKTHKTLHTKKIFHKINTRVTSREGPKPRTQEIPQERCLLNNHKNFHKRDGISITRATSRERSPTNTRTSSRERLPTNTKASTRERSSPYTQELPQERGIHHKHKSFSKNTRLNPRRAPPPQARTIEEICTKIIDQEQNL